MKNKALSETLTFYEKNADEFCSSTSKADMRHLYAKFLPLIPGGGKILDAGCGSGRDAANFIQLGFEVTAFDASKNLASLASKMCGIDVKVMTFNDVDWLEQFDGIWACASLLHVREGELDEAIRKLSDALVRNGVFYASFKYGNSEGNRNGRFFNDFDENKVRQLLSRHSDLRLEMLWTTPDARPGREREVWLNVIFRKR